MSLALLLNSLFSILFFTGYDSVRVSTLRTAPDPRGCSISGTDLMFHIGFLRFGSYGDVLPADCRVA